MKNSIASAIANLLKIKSIFSIAAVIIMIASLKCTIPDWTQSVVLMIVAFYFGKQSGEIPPK